MVLGESLGLLREHPEKRGHVSLGPRHQGNF